MATTLLRPNADVSNQWAITDGGSTQAWQVLDDVVTQPDNPVTASDFISEPTQNHAAEVAVETLDLTGQTVTQVKAWANGIAGSTSLGCTMELRHGSTVLATATFPNNAVRQWLSATFTGSLTQAQADDLRIRFVKLGSSAQAIMYAAYVEVTHEALSVTVQGAASLSGSGAVTAAADAFSRGGAALSGAGSVAASGRGTSRGASTLAASGAVTAAARMDQTGAAVLSGVGSLAASGAGSSTGGAVLSGVGSLSLAALATARATATLAGVGGVSAAAVMQSTGAASLAGIGTLTVATRQQEVGAIHGTGSASGVSGSGSVSGVGEGTGLSGLIEGG